MRCPKQKVLEKILWKKKRIFIKPSSKIMDTFLKDGDNTNNFITSTGVIVDWGCVTFAR